MWKRTTSLAALAVVVLLITAACSKTPAIDSSDATVEGDHTTEAPATVEASGDLDRVIEVELSEFAIDAANFEFVPGETVEFVVTNVGVVEHELRLSNQDRVDEHLADSHDDDGTSDGHDDADDDGHGEGAEDAVLHLEAGESGTLVFTFPDNDHDYTAAVCLIPGHYEAGMATDLSYDA